MRHGLEIDPPGEGLGSAVVAQLVWQLTHTGPLVTVLHSVLNARDTLRRKDKSGQLTKLGANFRLLIGTLKIAAGALARLRTLPAVSQGDSDTGRFEPWSHGRHLGVFHDVHALAQRG